MKFISKSKDWIVAHKKTSAAIVIVILALGYWAQRSLGSSTAQTRYVLAAVQKGTIISSITGSGQVSASNQVDLKSGGSGTITSLPVAVGQTVKAGTLIASVNDQSAYIALQNAQIALQKLTQSATPADTHAAEDSVGKDYNDGWSAVSDTFLAYPDISTGLNDLFYSKSGYLSDNNASLLSQNAQAYRQKAGVSFDQAKAQYQKVLISYDSLSRTSDTASIKAVITDTLLMSQSFADAVKNTQNAITYISTTQPSYNATELASASSNVNTWLSEVDGHVSSLLSSKNAIVADEDQLAKLRGGADPLDIKSSELALLEKQTAYNDTVVRAPFDGVIAKVDFKKGDSVANGDVIATFITQQKIAQISLNEIDAAKIKAGQKVTLTFDAIDGLTITGVVAEIDLVGTVSQGVVSYNVKISFDTDDDRIKPGMTVSASIITDMKQDVLTVPNSAIKSQGDNSFVQMFGQPLVGGQSVQGATSAVLPKQVRIEVGLSNDTETEIVSGVKEGDLVVSRIIAATAKAATAAPSLFGGAGTRTGTGGATRATTR